MRTLALAGPARTATYAAGVLLAPLVAILAIDRLATRGYRRPREVLAARLAEEGVAVAELGARFVGFAPADRPRLYDGQGSWDVGFFALGGDRLAYRGDLARFALRRGQIERVRLGSGPPSWLRQKSLYLDWRDEDGAVGTLWVRAIGPSLSDSGRETCELAAELTRWWEGGAAEPTSPELPAALTSSPAPPTDTPTGLAYRQALRPRAFVVWAWVIFVFAAAACFLTGLGDDLLYVASSADFSYLVASAPALLARDRPC